MSSRRRQLCWNEAAAGFYERVGGKNIQVTNLGGDNEDECVRW